MAGKKTDRELKELLVSLVDRITANFAVDEIILFGSYAKGLADDNSDIDIAVISPEFSSELPMYKNAMALSRKANLYEPYVQLVPFESRVYYNEKHIDPGFIRSIKNTGKTLYARV